MDKDHSTVSSSLHPNHFGFDRRTRAGVERAHSILPRGWKTLEIKGRLLLLNSFQILRYNYVTTSYYDITTIVSKILLLHTKLHGLRP